jgi:hypothetical protein
MDDGFSYGLRLLGMDPIERLSETAREIGRLRAMAARFPGTDFADLCLAQAKVMARPPRPSDVLVARHRRLVRENATLRREADAAQTHRERELIDQQVEIRRLQRSAADAATIAKGLRSGERATEAATPPPPPKPVSRFERERLARKKLFTEAVARLNEKAELRERYGAEAFEQGDA